MPGERVLDGLDVVELAPGTCDLGFGMAAALPGMVLADHGASVTRLVTGDPLPLDRGIEWGRVWTRGKRTRRLDLDDSADLETACSLVLGADVAIVGGSEAEVEARGLGYADLAPHSERLVYCRIGPSETATRGVLPDYDDLLEAEFGLLAQLPTRREGPVFCDFPTAGSGTAAVVLTGVLAALVERERTGRGQGVATSLYDGMVATLGLIVGRAEHPDPSMVIAWDKGAMSPAWVYECSDGRWVHINPGSKGIYDTVIELMGDEPSEQGLQADLHSGNIFERDVRWQAAMIQHDSATWMERFREANVPAEPVLDPGEVLLDEHLRVTGLSVEQPDADHGAIVCAGPTIQMRGFQAGPGAMEPDRFPPEPPSGTLPHPDRVWASPGDRLLEGVRVLDFSNFVAGPLGDQVLADLGADVVKVEALDGDPLRPVNFAFVMCQRGKRGIALDLKSPKVKPALDALFAWCDVVHHNFRPGVAERLGIDEASVRAVNPGAVYVHTPGYGSRGPRALLGGFDQLFQALCGIEAAAGGEAAPPCWLPWAPMDTLAGWLAGAAILLGSYARLRTGQGQYVESPQLGSGVFAKSGVFAVDGEPVPGPALDQAQTGYGPGYRIYRTADDTWIAVVVPDDQAWSRLLSVVDLDLTDRFVPLRIVDADAARQAEVRLEEAMRLRTAAEWERQLEQEAIPCCQVTDVDRRGLSARLFDDPLNQRLGRVTAFQQGSFGSLEQVGFPFRFSSGPLAVRRPCPGLGEHTEEVLDECGLEADVIDALAREGVIALGTPMGATA